MKPTKISSAYTVSLPTVVGQNSEMADMSNPEGYIYRDVHCVQAETPNGQRFNHTHSFKSLEEAQNLAQKVQAQGEILTEADWVETYPAYGSSAWSEEDLERQTYLHIAISQNDLEAIERYS